MAELRDYEERTYKALVARENRYARQVQRVLLDALNAMRAEMTVIYEKYASDGVLTLAQMTQYNRLQSLEKQVLAELDAATRKAVGTIDKLRPEQYGESFFRHAWAVDNATGLRLRWGQLNRAAVLESLNNRDYQLAVTTYRPDARVKILRALNNGLAQGKSYTQMAKDIKGAINATYAQAIRIIRTEGMTAINAGTDAAYTVAEERGVKMGRRWVATLDDRTRDDHRSMDGVETQEDGLFHLPNGETAPFPAWQGLSSGERINCRCTESAIIEGYEPALRRTREQGVIPYQTYEQWSGLHAKRWR